MINSMSGYGRGVYEDEKFDISVEVKSLNGRYLDVNIKSPNLFNFADNGIRNSIKNKVNRGRVDVYIKHTNKSTESIKITPNHLVLEGKINCLREIAKTYGVVGEVSLEMLANNSDIYEYTYEQYEEEQLFSLLENALNIALDNLCVMRGIEGEAIAKDLNEKLSKINKLFSTLCEVSHSSSDQFLEKLRERVNGALEHSASEHMEVDESRLLQEIIVYADRSCIDEEIVRFRTHVDNFRVYLRNGGIIGKKLDFLLQEMNRELNTMASKSQHVEISNLVIELKSLVEMLREQVQNIE